VHFYKNGNEPSGFIKKRGKIIIRDLFTKFVDSCCGLMLYNTVSSGKRVQIF
jgi:hypothetical protein